MIRRRKSHLPAVLMASVAIHAGGLLLLFTLPEGRALIAQVVPVRIVEREKPKPPPRRPRPRARLATPHAARPQPRPAAAPPPDAASPENSFGLGVEDTEGGTLAVPVGNSLEATSSAPPPLVLDLEDGGAGEALEQGPEPIGRLRVSYPETARLAGATGSAVVQAFVEASGLVSRLELLSASAPAFGRAALEALRQTRFRPATRAGVRVACSIRLPVAFELHAQAALPAAVASYSLEATGPWEATPSLAASAATESLAPLATPSLLPGAVP